MAEASLVPLVDLEEVIDESQTLIEAHAPSLAVAGRLLKDGRGPDLAVVYAFCWHVTNTFAEEPGEQAARAKLTQLLAELDGAHPPAPRTAAYLDVARRYELPPKAAIHLVEGALSDLDEIRINDDDELIRYCYRVAGVVAVMLVPVMGADDPRALPHAIDLGIGMQLTNIAVDVKKDAAAGRIYLPLERLAEYGVTPEDVLSAAPSARAIQRVTYDILKIAERYYRSADQGMRFVPPRNRRAIVTGARLYRALGRKLARYGYNPFHGPTRLSFWGRTYWIIRSIFALGSASLRGKSLYAPHNQWLHRRLDGFPGTNAR